MNKSKAALAFFLAAAVSAPAQAFAVNAVFNGTISPSCAITMDGAGILAEYNTLRISTNSSGGAPATGNVVSNSDDFLLTVGHADWSGTSAPTEPDLDIVEVIGTGASAFTINAGDSASVVLGKTDLTVGIIGWLSAGGPLHAGNYNAIVTLTCL